MCQPLPKLYFATIENCRELFQAFCHVDGQEEGKVAQEE